VLIAVAEAVVYQQRYKATNGSAWSACGWTLMVCLLRAAWLGLGVSAVLKDQWLLAAVLYAVPAAIVTGLVRAREIRRERADLMAMKWMGPGPCRPGQLALRDPATGECRPLKWPNPKGGSNGPAPIHREPAPPPAPPRPIVIPFKNAKRDQGGGQ
jgi:hypothetical protein